MALLADQAGELSGGSLTAVTRVVVGVDDSDAGVAAVAAAASLARSAQAPLLAVRAWALGLPRHGGRRLRRLSHPHVVLSFSGTEQCAEASVLVRHVFEAALGKLPPGVPVRVLTPDGDPGLSLVRLADQPGDVIVVGKSHGSPVRHLIHGSVSHYCIRHAACPVLTVPADRADSAR
ncbi:MAG: universal stress protein [Streptosporangiaceae bacterium]|jgi:nucleotide-binding universal stress UspA family protein